MLPWISLVGLSLILWALCGSVIALGRRVWSLNTTLYVHLVAAPVFAFALAGLHKLIAPGFDQFLRAAIMTGHVIVLDVALVAPVFERSFVMFRSLIGTWIPFIAIFLASWAAGAVW